MAQKHCSEFMDFLSRQNTNRISERELDAGLREAEASSTERKQAFQQNSQTNSKLSLQKPYKSSASLRTGPSPLSLNSVLQDLRS